MEEYIALERLQELGWVAEIFGVVAVTLLARYVALRVLKKLGSHIARTKTVWDDALFDAAYTPVSWFMLIFGLIWAIDISNGYVNTELFSDTNLAIVRQLTFITLVTTFLVNFISRAETGLLERPLDDSDPDMVRADPTVLHAMARLLRASIIISAVLIAMPTLGIEVTALLAFGGASGIAVGFAAQDLLANFFGGLLIFLDKPFAIGDWIRSPDRNIEGTVESIGWRVTVVRTFDKRPLYIPNSVFSTLAIENPSRMTNRRIKEYIGIRFQDADRMESVVEDVKTMLRSHEEIDTGLTLIVNFDKSGSSSLEFLVYTFTKTTNWIRYHEIKQDVMLKIIDIIHANGAELAFPTTTLEGIKEMVEGPGNRE